MIVNQTETWFSMYKESYNFKAPITQGMLCNAMHVKSLSHQRLMNVMVLQHRMLISSTKIKMHFSSSAYATFKIGMHLYLNKW